MSDLDYYYDCDAYLSHSDSLDVSLAKIVDTHDVTIVEIAAALTILLYSFDCVCFFFDLI